MENRLAVNVHLNDSKPRLLQMLSVNYTLLYFVLGPLYAPRDRYVLLVLLRFAKKSGPADGRVTDVFLIK